MAITIMALSQVTSGVCLVPVTARKFERACAEFGSRPASNTITNSEVRELVRQPRSAPPCPAHIDPSAQAAHKVAAGKAKFLCFSEIHTFLQPRFAVCSKVAGDGMKNIIWNEKVNL
jgi:hypothetical protein